MSGATSCTSSSTGSPASTSTAPPLAELGPGAVIGERALLEGGARTSTVVAVTPLRVAVAARDAVDLDRLRTLAESHHREDLVDAEGAVAEPLEQPIDLD